MSKRMIFVIPLKDLVVRIPKTKAKLPEQGAWVPTENYWLRRIIDGSVREALPPRNIPIAEEVTVPKQPWVKKK